MSNQMCFDLCLKFVSEKAKNKNSLSSILVCPKGLNPFTDSTLLQMSKTVWCKTDIKGGHGLAS